MKKLELFDQNHGLTTLQKCQFCLLFKSMFILPRKGFFFKENVTKYFFWVYFASNETLTKFIIFDQNHGLTPLQNCQFCGFLKTMFWLFGKACLLNETSKIVFSRLIFSIYDMGIQRVTGGYKGLQGLTRGYKRLELVTRGYKGWQGVTRGYRGLQGIMETFF